MKKILLLFLLLSFAIVTKGFSQCNTNVSICTPGTAGPFSFGTGGTPVSSCLDWMPTSQFTYIILYITQSGPLNLLIQGNATTGFLDVSIFNIPTGQSPCTAIQNPANEIGCNYASASSGCNQFGNAFGCPSQVPAPYVNAGDVLMIVVEDWQNGASSNFTLQLGPPPGAQTGPPDATINPVGPFCVTSPSVQLTAADMGGNWSGPGTSSTGVFNPATAGVGTFIVNYTIGSAPCSATNSTSITVFNTPPVAPANTGPYCAGQTINLSTTAVGGATYSWSGPGGFTSNLQNPTIGGSTVANSGTYTVTVTAGGCSSTATTSVVVNPSPTPSVGNTGPYCAGSTISLNSGGGTGYQWSGPGGFTSTAQNPTIPGSTAANGGVYTVVVTATGGCTATATTSVTINPAPAPVVGNTGPYCPGATISLTSGGGTGYSWTGPGGFTSNVQNPTIPSSTVANSGIYTVTVTGAGGCTATATTTVTVSPPAAATAGNTGPYCAGSSISLSTVAGTGYSWTGPGGFTSTVQNPVIPGATAANGGVYTVTVTYAGGCTSSATTSVVINPSPTPSIGNTGPYCAGATISLTSGGGTGYSWTGPGGYTSAAQNPTIPGSTAANGGVYTVTVTGAGSCTATATTSVTVNPLPVPVAGNTGPFCTGATISLTSGGGTGYSWTGPGGFTSTAQNPAIPSSTAANAGVYTVTVTGTGGCTSTATTSVVVNPLPVGVSGNTGPYCAGATISLTSGGGTGYSWAGPGGFTNNTQNPTIPGSTVANGGVYTVTVAGAGGCTSTSTTSVTVNPLPTPVVGNTGPYCAGATISLTSSGGTGYSWTGPGGFTSTVQNPAIPSSTAANSGLYTVTVSSGAGCTATGTTNVTVNPLPASTAGNTGSYCPGATIQLNSSGGTGYSWTGPGGFTSTAQNPTIPGAAASHNGVYTVNVTSAAGCSATATTTVVVNAAAVAVANNTGPYCAGSTISLTSPAGPINWNWTGPGGFTANNTQNPTIPSSTVLMSGTYTVTTTMTGGCTATGTTTVVVNPLPTPTANNTGPYCAGATIQLNSPAGSATDDWTGPNAFTQTNVQNPTITSSTAAMSGVYTVTVTDANNCSATATTNVVVNALPVPTASNTGPYCAGTTVQLNSPTGSATDDWTGPGGYTQANTQNPTRPTSTVAMSGVYTVTVTNAAGCGATATTSVTVNALPVPTATNTGPYCAGATIQLNSPTGSATDDWTGPGGYTQANTQNPTRPTSTVAMSGVYTVTVTDGNNCSATATTSVTVNALPVPTATNTGPYCAGATIQLNSPSGNATDDWTGPNSFTQSNVQNPTIASSTTVMSGIYTVTVTDGNNCSATATTNVVVNALPVPTANNTGPYCAGTTIQLNSPTGSATDDWTGPSGYTQNNTQNPTIVSSTVAMTGIYTVTVTNASNCSATATTSVVVNALPVPTANNTGPYCAGSTIQLNSPTGSATDDWTGPGGYAQNNVQNPNINSSTAAMSGVYTVTVTNANNCSATATTTVVVNALPAPSANNTGPYCAGETIDLSSSGGVDYDWSGPNGFVSANTQNPTIPSATSIMSGVYTVSVTDANGCNSITSTTVTVNNLPNVTAGNNSPVCEFQNVNLTSSGGVDYDWTGPNGYTSANTQNPVITSATNAQSGVYTVTVTDANGCVSTATTSLSINPDLVFNATSNSAICAGSTLTLTADNIPTATYNWAGPNGFTAVNQQNPSIPSSTVAASGTYTVLATNSGGCTGTATVNVVINPMPAASFAGNTLTGCAPVCVNFSDLTNTNGATITSWNWNVEGQTSSTTQNTMYCFNDPGQYDASLTVTSSDGCTNTLSLLNYITVNSNPVAGFNFSPDEIFFSDPEVSFGSTSTGATGWSWNFGDGTTGAGENPIHLYQDTGMYCVTLLVTNSSGCTDTAVGCLFVKPVFSLYIPNSFTPNGDGTNEIWNVYGEGINSIIVRIFDRWGVELYSFDNISKGWPGTTTNLQPCMQGVYVYRIEVVDGKNDFHEYIGNVNLIR